MSEFLLDEDEDRVEFVRPDPSGFTLRTRYKNTQDVLDANQRKLNDSDKHFRGDRFHHVGSVPQEVWDQWCRDLGRPPTAAEAVMYLQQREYSRLRTKKGKF